MDDLAELRALSLSALRQRCKELEVDTAPLLEKEDWVNALHEAQEAMATAEAAAEEEALRQALLMSEETSESLSALPVAELRSRCKARGISTVGLAERSDLVTALLGDAMDVSDAAPAAPPAAAPPEPAAVEIIAAFAERFWCQAVAPEDDGAAAALDPLGGKVLLPHSCLQAIAMLVGGALPTTMLLRLTYMESSVYVGVADFVPDRVACEWLRPKEELPPTGPPTWGMGALAAGTHTASPTLDQLPCLVSLIVCSSSRVAQSLSRGGSGARSRATMARASRSPSSPSQRPRALCYSRRRRDSRRRSEPSGHRWRYRHHPPRPSHHCPSPPTCNIASSHAAPLSVQPRAHPPPAWCIGAHAALQPPPRRGERRRAHS